MSNGFYRLKRFFTADVSRISGVCKNAGTFIIYGLLYDAVINIYKPFSMKFLTRLGGDEAYLSLLNSLPGITAALALLPGAVFLSRYTNTRRVTSVIFLTSRSVLLVLAAVPFFPEHIRPALFIGLMSVMNLPDALSQSSVQASLGSFVPDGKIRAAAISLRIKYGNVLIPAVILLTGAVIRIFPKNEPQVLAFYQFFFVAAFVVGLFEIRTYRRFTEESAPHGRSMPHGRDRPDIRTVKAVFNNKRFMSYFFTTIVFYVTWHAGWALSSIYQIQNLGADEAWIALFNVTSGVASYVSANFWNKRIVKDGNDKTLVLAVLCVALNMFTVVSSPNLYILNMAMLFNGFAVIGISTVLLNSLIAATPDNDRMVYIGVYNTFVNISLGVAPLITLYVINRAGVAAALYTVGTARLLVGLWLLVRLLIKTKKTAV